MSGYQFDLFSDNLCFNVKKTLSPVITNNPSYNMLGGDKRGYLVYINIVKCDGNTWEERSGADKRCTMYDVNLDNRL